jgi:hypothetical protein
MAGEEGFHVARAYVTVEPDATDFPEKLKAQLEENKFDLRVPVAPQMDGFREEMQAGLEKEKGQDVTVDVEPDPGSVADFTPKVQAALDANKAKVEAGVEPDQESVAGLPGKVQAELDAERKPTLNIKSNLDEASLAAKVAEARSELGDLKIGDDLFAAFSRTGSNSFIAQYATDLKDLTGDAEAAAGAVRRTAAAVDQAGAAARKSDQAFRIFGVGISKLAVHGVVTGVIDFLAVAIPAAAAAGAWAAAWSKGAEQVEQHMVALHTATQATNAMFGQTTGSALGLGGALAKAQTAARPEVWSALGAAINLAKERMGDFSSVGLQVGRIFDNFAAKLVYDFSSAGDAGKTFGGLLSNMVPDLTQLGEVFGNIGHAVGSFASQMPGVAQVLLAGLAGATKLATSLIDLSGRFKIAGASALTLIMGFHELNTWGSIGVAALGKMGLATSEVTGGFFSLERAGGVLSNMLGVVPTLLSKITAGLSGMTRGVGSVVSGLGGMVGKIGGDGNVFSKLGAGAEGAGSKVDRLGVTIGGLGSDLEESASGLGLWQVALIGAAAAGLGFLIYKLATTKTAAQQFADSLQASIDKASNLQSLSALAAGMGQLGAATQKAATQQQYAGGMSTRYAQTLSTAGAAVATFGAKQEQLAEQFVTVNKHASMLATQYGTSFVGALALADEAGVKLNQTMTRQQWVMAQIKISDLVKGYQAMGQPMGAVGNDMDALAIQSGLAATKVAALNSAWDEFMSNLTGGTTGLAGFEQALTNLSTGTTKITNVLGKGGSVTLSVKDFASSLQSFTGKGAQAWQNFNQVVGTSAPQLIDWLRTAGAEGALSGQNLSHGLSQGTTAAKNFQQGILDMISQLTPLASKSKTAQAELVGLAQQAGLNITTFPQLTSAIQASHASVSNLQAIISQATIKMGNMSAVAQNLGNVLNSAVASAISNASLKASGFYKDMSDLTAATQKYGANSPQAIAAANKVATALHTASADASSMATNVGKAGNASATAGDQMETAATKAYNLRTAIDDLHSKTVDINVLFNISGKQPGAGVALPGAPQYAAGGVVPGRDTGRDEHLVLARGGEGMIIPEAVQGLGGPKAIDAINRAYGGGRKTARGRFAAGGVVTESAQFGFPQDVFNFQIGPIGFGGSRTTVGGGGAFTGFQQLADELKGFKTAGAQYPGQSASSYANYLATIKKDNASRFAQMEADGKKLVAAFSEGTLTTVAAIKSEAATALKTLQTYYSGPAASRLEATITRQTTAMEKLAAASAKVSATIANMKAFSAQEVQSLQGFSNISNITGTTNSTTGATAPPTGAQIKAGLQKMLAQLRQFEAVIKKLKAEKVASVMIEQVIQLGPEEGIQYGQAILAGGKTLIAQINKTEKAITGEETVIGHTSAEIQYGQSITKGFLASLEKQETTLKKKMQNLGDEIAKELAKALGVPLATLKKDEGIGKSKLAPAPKIKNPVTPPHIVYKPPTVHPDAKTTNVKQDIHITVNSPKGYFSPEQLAAIKHEISAVLAISH